MQVIVCFSTIPSRIERILPMVESIVKQTYTPDKVYLFVSEICVRENAPYEIPEWIEGMGITVVQVEKDYGTATKLIPALQMGLSPDDIIITVDDDIVYEEHLVEELVTASKEYPDCCIGFLGIGSGYVHSEYIEHYCVPIPYCLGGYRGICYRRRFFDYELLMKQYDDIFDDICIVDDQFFSTHVKKMGHQLLVVRTNYPKHHDKDNYEMRGYPYDLEINGRILSLNFSQLYLGNGVNEGDNLSLSEKELKRFDDCLSSGKLD